MTSRRRPIFREELDAGRVRFGDAARRDIMPAVSRANCFG
jgi:hypothetical protein